MVWTILVLTKNSIGILFQFPICTSLFDNAIYIQYIDTFVEEIRMLINEGVSRKDKLFLCSYYFIVKFYPEEGQHIHKSHRFCTGKVIKLYSFQSKVLSKLKPMVRSTPTFSFYCM